MMSLRNYFQPCLDLPGVLGAFCLNPEGRLLESFMPAPYTRELLGEFSARLLSLFNAVNLSYTHTDELFLRFDSHALYAVRFQGVILGVFTETSPNLAGIRISCNLLWKLGQEAILAAACDESAAVPPGQAPAEVMAIEDADEILLPAPSITQEKESGKTSRGFFGIFRSNTAEKDKPKKSNDIWG